VPVNYCSRSYSEGKKVTIIGDPLLWIKANFKFRVISPFKPMRQAYREARQQMSKGKAKPRVKGEAMTAAHVIDFSITDDSAIIAATLNENQSSTPVGQTTVSEAKS
jgi:hypothetical protein